jgi:hypothetical protein
VDPPDVVEQFVRLERVTVFFDERRNCTQQREQVACIATRKYTRG